MRSVTLVACLCAAYLSTSSAYDYGDYKTYNVREYTEPGMKCAGAPGKPYVHYAPCTKGYMCAMKDTYGKGEWGRYCVKGKVDYSKKCYNENERCIGAPGKPFVQYYPCCKSSLICTEDPHLGYGSFCVKSDKSEVDYPSTKEPLSTTKSPKTSEPHYPEYDNGYPSKKPDEPEKLEKKSWGYKKCHATGYRCAGAPGYPYVNYGDGCCSADDMCVPNSKLGWGRFCVSKDATEPKYYSTLPSKTEAPATAPYNWAPVPPKCISTGYAGCTPAMKGYKGSKSCCNDEDECVSDPSYYKGQFYCAAPVEPAPTPEAYKYYYR